MPVPPLVHELTPVPAIPHALRSLADRTGVILFDSALPRGGLGRYSFLSADPFATFAFPVAEYGCDPFREVRAVLDEFRTQPVEGLPPFQGGASGLLCYELGRCWERLPAPRWDEFSIPVCVIGLYDWVLAWDHQQNRCWFLSQGFPEKSASRRHSRAQEQLHHLLQSLEQQSSPSPLPLCPPSPLPLGPSSPLPLGDGLFSNFTHDEYLAAVQHVIDDIRAGEIFQANLSQRLLAPAHLPPMEQYLRLRESNPAPFAGYFSHDDWAVLSSSPERFLQVTERDGRREVITRPIKGTRQRRPVPEADLFTRDELRESEKDQAENIMIVDLLRNDLSRVCRPGSIRVPELCSVEAYETVTHLVSEVRGELREGATFWDLLRAAFPGGSITGAPKIRAMEIITEIEQVARGPYCGSLFYCGFDGTADSSILIRTMTQRSVQGGRGAEGQRGKGEETAGGWLQFPAGGGIVAQSVPENEYAETLHKAQGMLRALHRPTARH
jgi:para-aminobenzoate synthetase component I